MARGRRSRSRAATSSCGSARVEGPLGAVAGMDEAQAHRVQRRAPEHRIRAAVHGVADDRMADRGEMDANLMRAAGAQRELEHGRAGEALDHPEVGDRFATAFDDGHAPAGRAGDARSARRWCPVSSRKPPCTSAQYVRPSVRSLSCRARLRWAASVLATTSSPLVSRSSRCTIPARSAAAEQRPRRPALLERRRRACRWDGRARGARPARTACRSPPAHRPRRRRRGPTCGCASQRGGRRARRSLRDGTVTDDHRALSRTRCPGRPGRPSTVTSPASIRVRAA